MIISLPLSSLSLVLALVKALPSFSINETNIGNLPHGIHLPIFLLSLLLDSSSIVLLLCSVCFFLGCPITLLATRRRCCIPFRWRPITAATTTSRSIANTPNKQSNRNEKTKNRKCIDLWHESSSHSFFYRMARSTIQWIVLVVSVCKGPHWYGTVEIYHSNSFEWKPPISNNKITKKYWHSR